MAVEDVYKDLKQKLLTIRKDLALNPGSVINDIFLEPTAYIINKNRVLLEYIKILQSFDDILNLLNDTKKLTEIAEVEQKTIIEIKNDIKTFIDKIAANYGLTRHPATYATGYVYFGRFDPPQFDITIPVGTEVKTLDGKYYKTTSEVTMYANGFNYYDENENLYLVKVPVIAMQIGSEGNTTAYTINTIINSIAGISYVLNKENIANGIDEETDEHFINRIKSVLTGNNLATKDGIKNLILNNFPTVKDLIIITPNDELLLRDPEKMGGKIDVYILEESLPVMVTNEQHNVFDLINNSYKGFYLNKQPIKYDANIQKVLNLAPSDYVFVKDNTSTLNNSKFERSFVYFLNPEVSLPLVVQYLYYPICEQIQNFLNLEKNAIVGTIDGSLFPTDVTILIKKAIQRNLNIKFRLGIVSGYDFNILKNQISNIILNFVNKTLLNSKINQSDIINIVEEVDGVDFVDFTNGIFDLDGTDLKVYVEANKIEYIRLGELIIEE